MSLHTIHHVTAVTGRIDENLAFYTGVLGLRLVKRSVNQDDVTAYHLFYADASGSPGTDLTFFDWPAIGPNVPGRGTIALTRFRVPQGALEYWQGRLQQAGCQPVRGENELTFSDPEGQRLQLAASSEPPRSPQPWTERVPAETAIQGILGVDLESARPDSTRSVLTELLGFSETEQGVFRANGADRLAELRIVPATSERLGRVGAGGVHHVAFRVTDDEELRAAMERVEAAGLRTSGQIDRFWFHSVYFREPGGVLFELATDGPGFGVDEDPQRLGERLVLPPFLEPHRERIERGLRPLPGLSLR